MTADVWRRLALVAACSAYVTGLVAVTLVVGAVAAAVVLAGGFVLAGLLSVDLTAAATVDDTGVRQASTNALDDELKRRAQRGDVPVATRRGRPLATGNDPETS